jgi:uncharacterized integral membrane protein
MGSADDNGGTQHDDAAAGRAEALDGTAAGAHRVRVRHVLSGILAVVLVFFVVQNADQVSVRWMVWSGKAPLWLIVVGSALAGAVVAQLVAWLVGRRDRQR